MKVFEIAKHTLLSLVFAVKYHFRLRSSGGWGQTLAVSFLLYLSTPFLSFPSYQYHEPTART